MSEQRQWTDVELADAMKAGACRLEAIAATRELNLRDGKLTVREVYAQCDAIMAEDTDSAKRRYLEVYVGIKRGWEGEPTVVAKIWDGENHHNGESLREALDKFLAAKRPAPTPPATPVEQVEEALGETAPAF